MMMMVAVRGCPRGLVPCIAGARPLKVAYLHQGLPVGGVESSLVNICRHADRFRLSPCWCSSGGTAATRCWRTPCVAAEVARFGARWREADWSISWDEGEVDRLEYLAENSTRFHAYGGLELGEPTPLGIAAAQRGCRSSRASSGRRRRPGPGDAAAEVSTVCRAAPTVEGRPLPAPPRRHAVEVPSAADVLEPRRDRRALVVGALAHRRKDPIRPCWRRPGSARLSRGSRARPTRPCASSSPTAPARRARGLEPRPRRARRVPPRR